MQARIPGRTAKMIWMTQIQKTAPISPWKVESLSILSIVVNLRDDFLLTWIRKILHRSGDLALPSPCRWDQKRPIRGQQLLWQCWSILYRFAPLQATSTLRPRTFGCLQLKIFRLYEWKIFIKFSIYFIKNVLFKKIEKKNREKAELLRNLNFILEKSFLWNENSHEIS